MRHPARAFRVRAVGSAEELADALTARLWTLCTAFRLGQHLFLNDADHEDGPQEYVVVQVPAGRGRPHRQVETVTVAPGDPAAALARIRRAVGGRHDRSGLPLRNLCVESAADHDGCQHCA